MKTPIGLLGAALLFWGWQCGLLIWAVPMAIVLEASRFLATRWEFSSGDLKRIWNLCAVLFFGTGIVLYSSEETVRVPLKFTQWIPFPFFPMMLAQAYGNWEKIPLSVFSWFLRRNPETPIAKKTLNVSYLYFALCLLAASATKLTTPLFYPGVVLLIVLALVANRPARLSVSLWVGLITIVAVSGHFGHQQLHMLHGNLEGALARWFVGLFSRQMNMDESQTAIGRVGRISLSGRIVLRLEPEPGGSPPALLRDGSYDVFYRNTTWRNSQNEFATVFVDTNDVATLQEPKALNFSVGIASYLSGGRGELSLPHGSYELHLNFPVVLETNRMGIARIQEGPGLLDMVAYYGPGKSRDAPGSTMDLEIPKQEKATILQIARELNLGEEASERKKLEKIANFFRDHFSYSMEITRKHIDSSGQRTPLGQFLTVARSGHCEYFATATVLLLRQAGIPARYATGYLVDESERRGKTYFVRERDAHAWAMVFRKEKGIWEEFDTTPASAEREVNLAPSSWERISDFFANLKFQFAKWRWSKTSYSRYLSWLLVPLVLFLVWRILAKRTRQRLGSLTDSTGVEPVWPGSDSEFYQFDQKMTALGLGRLPNEPTRYWQQRLEFEVDDPARLAQIFEVHHRLRFDPIGVTEKDRHQLRSSVEYCLRQFEAHPAIKSV
ncbi:MAG: transglutaminase-like domain-containing protein [Verrucomicrobiota bacterium]